MQHHVKSKRSLLEKRGARKTNKREKGKQHSHKRKQKNERNNEEIKLGKETRAQTERKQGRYK
jgi:hypothetical protein